MRLQLPLAPAAVCCLGLHRPLHSVPLRLCRLLRSWLLLESGRFYCEYMHLQTVQHNLMFSFYLLQVPGLVLITHAVCTVVTSAIDPSEAGVRDKHALHTARTPFNRSVHKHVIEDEYCHICEVMV